MVKKDVNETESTQVRTSPTNYIRGLRESMRRCIGDVCVSTQEDGQPIIDINIDGDKNPKCAKLLNDIIPYLKTPVRFNIKKVVLGKETEETKV